MQTGKEFVQNRLASKWKDCEESDFPEPDSVSGFSGSVFAAGNKEEDKQTTDQSNPCPLHHIGFLRGIGLQTGNCPLLGRGIIPVR